MSIDMTEFYQVFFEESAELLGQMEQLLLNLDVENPDPEHLNAIFRVAHSIKGGSATFGFNDMAEVTHVLESLLDQIRKGEKRLRSEMVDVFLAAGDVIKSQLAGHRGEGEADPALAQELCEKLKVFVAEEDAPASTAPDTDPAPAVVPAVAAVPAGQFYEIDFSLDGAPQDTRTLLDHVFTELERLGTVRFIKGARAGGVVETAAGKTTQYFDLQLVTAASEEDIWELLAFNIDPARVGVVACTGDPAPVKASPAAPETGAAQLESEPAPAEDPGYGFFEDLYHAVVPADTAATPGTGAAASVAQEQPAESRKTPESGASRSPGRRAADDPDTSVMRTGRRDNDKVAVTAAASGDASSIRVNIEKVDHLINLVGELVIAQAMLAQTVSKVDPVTGEALTQGMNQLERNMRDLQEAVMSIRMMPVGFVFSRFPRVVRDLAAKLNKQVELKMQGEGTELDKGLIEKIADPLNHLVRNSLDHGIEAPDQRVALGKPAKGTITLSAFHQGGSIVVEVSDDGAGLNRERILAKAKERGLPVHDNIPDQDVWQLIFEAGFSTAEKVTDVSGRGVGMDVVKRNIQALGGSVEIESQLGIGTRMSIRLPLTLAILDGMSVSVGGEVFIVPLTAIVESLQPRRKDVKSIQGQGRVVQVRGEYLPVVALHEVFGITPGTTDIEQGIFVILEAEGTKKAIYVDGLLGQHQVVIKSLESNYRRTKGVSGATIMGDGRVALILDVGAIIRMSRGRLLEAA